MRIANARMYSATPAVKAAWRDVLRWVLARAALDWPVIDHDEPAPLAELWRRDDLGLAMMCGLPYSRRRPPALPIAAPVPSAPRYGGRPIYFTDLVVKTDSRFEHLEDTFGGVVGYTVADSLSGFVALRSHLLRYRREDGRPLYREVVGNLIHARGVIDALAAGRIDVGPLDSYYHDLLRRNDPQFAAQVRVVATTAAAPIPPLVATAPIDALSLERLRKAIAAVGDTDELAMQRERLLLSRFAVPLASDYDVLAQVQSQADEFDRW